MVKTTTGYIGKDKNGKWFARVTLTATNGKRRNIARRAASKPEARQILRSILGEIENKGERVLDTARLTFNNLADFYAVESDTIFRAATALDLYHAQATEAQATNIELIQ